jgi:EAL domain-containing protein (putative c-di-GMP-specific phosphodiesterase class I)
VAAVCRAVGAARTSIAALREQLRGAQFARVRNGPDVIRAAARATPARSAPPARPLLLFIVDGGVADAPAGPSRGLRCGRRSPRGTAPRARVPAGRRDEARVKADTISSHVAAGAATKGRVLLVDDDRALLSLFEKLLRAAGYATTAVEDARVALELVAAGGFDAVVSDITMPQMDGLNLLRAIRSRAPDLPVVLVTGCATVDTAAQAIEHGVLRYLTKPVRREQLEDVVALAVRERTRRTTTASILPNLTDLDRLGSAFDEALDSLWMAYQPIVSWSLRRTVAYEALLRTRQPVLASPTAMIDAAERLRRMPDLGAEIRRASAAAVARLLPDQLLFVNLHPHELADDRLFAPDAPLSVIARRVVLEVTERALVQDMGELRARIGRLRAMGFRLAVDDLGAGYSGLSSLAQVEPEVVKLDMTLVRGIDTEPTKRKVVRAVCALGRDMGIQVVAEGVETATERDALVELGCDLLQGYYFARPAEEFPSVALH